METHWHLRSKVETLLREFALTFGRPTAEAIPEDRRMEFIVRLKIL